MDFRTLLSEFSRVLCAGRKLYSAVAGCSVLSRSIKYSGCHSLFNSNFELLVFACLSVTERTVVNFKL